MLLNLMHRARTMYLLKPFFNTIIVRYKILEYQNLVRLYYQIEMTSV